MDEDSAMIAMPNPFLSDSAAAIPNPAAEEAVAPTMPRSAAPPAAMENAPMAAGLLDGTDCIHEIFYHARRLVQEDNAVHRRFVLDVPAFMEAIEEPMPIFLRAAGDR